MQRASLAVLVWLACPATAPAHSWYPIECCSERDCAPFDARDVEEGAAGFLPKPSGELVSRAAARPSRDERFHVCRSRASGALLCLFVPDRGS
jgi:hypothetical protein